MLHRVRVTGLWSLAECTLSLRPMNVVLGANGAGKSSLLNVFRLLRAIVGRGMATFIAERGGASSVLHYGPKVTRHATIELVFEGAEGTHGYAVTLAFVAPDRLVFAEERVWFQRDGETHSTEHRLGPGAHPESALADAILSSGPAAPVAKAVKWHLDRVCHYHVHDTSMTAAMRQTCSVDDAAFLAPDGANLAAFLLAMRDANPAAYVQIRDVVRRVFPRFDDFVLEPQGPGGRSVILRWREVGRAYEFGPHQLSDGTLRFIAYAALLLQPGAPASAEHPNFPLLVVVDEPELGFHPTALALVGEMLQVFPAQRIVATQSVDMVGHLVSTADELDRLVLVDRVDGGSLFRRADPVALRPWLDDYAPGQLWTHGILGAMP